MPEFETEAEEALYDALTNLMAIERDRQLGYRDSELHMSPKAALRVADEALVVAGVDPTRIIWEDDRRKLGLER